MTKEEFIKKAKEIHGDKYDYSKVEYKNVRTKVIIICPKHEPFQITPTNHLSGQGCKLCGIEKRANKRKMAKEEFIKRAREIHGDKYDYSKVVYVNMHTEVIITCPKHGDFPQTPSNHLKGCGCSACSGTKKLSRKEFIKKARKIHGNEYDYSKVKYVNIHTEVIIICPKHGPFPQEPSNHLNNQGCPKCNKNKGEEAVRKFLTEKGVEFEEQKKFEGCKYKRLLKFDFYLPQYNLCIESDGNVHSEKINWNGRLTDKQMKEKLESYQIRDEIKNEYCKNNGINILRICYDENMKDKLNNYFNNFLQN